MWPGPMNRALFTRTSQRPHRSSTVVAAAPSDARSRRSAGTTSTCAPSASTANAVDVRLPGNGEVSDSLIVDECSRRSPSSTVRAVMATSKPERARWTAMPLPIPRLAPVTNATLRSPMRLDRTTASVLALGRRGRRVRIVDTLAPRHARAAVQRGTFHMAPGFADLDSLSRGDLLAVAYDYMLAGMLTGSALGPITALHGGIPDGDSLPIDQWMGASPVYTNRMRRLMGI